ncbi:uncharacterized protein BDZ99DRAFT_375093 [Mytilinidion resinicola]|uniref:Kinetochore protein fta4 n=1 Tax=Mytilinidion resinicola TaxID=574789 RepID=A0A6A6Z9L4_9PEZI|nr:uncharacterized protein BDZ99DRAFT_375093 [Mytilinidion resinicola]KAF2817706.1 hypothetical protein BDZ99DRAFT_375093 [Mytilinidion resinicola]
MSNNQHTVVALKSAFLRAQTRILSQELRPSERWRDGTESIPERIIRDVTLETNRLMRRHTKTAYGALSIRYVAEQIDQLYWNLAAPDIEVRDAIDADDSETTGLLRVGDDLTLDDNIAKLPPTWEEASSDQESSTGDGATYQERYLAAITQLQSLSAQRQMLSQKLSTYRALITLLEPYRKPQESIQPNLVTRDALLGTELAKTRTLAIRVAGRVQERFGESRGVDETEDHEHEAMEDVLDDSEKLKGIMAGW